MIHDLITLCLLICSDFPSDLFSLFLLLKQCLHQFNPCLRAYLLNNFNIFSCLKNTTQNMKSHLKSYNFLSYFYHLKYLSGIFLAKQKRIFSLSLLYILGQCHFIMDLFSEISRPSATHSYDSKFFPCKTVLNGLSLIFCIIIQLTPTWEYTLCCMFFITTGTLKPTTMTGTR